MFRSLAALPWLLLLACATPKAPAPPPANKWSDERLWTVLQAQDHRDGPALTALLADTSAAVREAAALALASVQDSASFRSLLPVLIDPDPRVRLAAAFALSFSPDTLLLAELEKRAWTDSGASAHADQVRFAFRAAVNRSRPDALFLLSYLESPDTALRIRASAMLGRCAKEQLLPLENSVVHALSVEKDPDVRTFLLLALKHSTDTAAIGLLERVASTDRSAEARVAAYRALGRKAPEGFLLEHLSDTVAAVRQTIMEQLKGRAPMDGRALLAAAERQRDPDTSIPLYGLALAHGDTPVRAAASIALTAWAGQAPGPYQQAELVKALFQEPSDLDTLRSIVLGPGPAVVRQAAFEQWLACADGAGTDRKSVPQGYDAARSAFLRDVLLCGDAGLIASACERIAEADAGDLKALLTRPVVSATRASLRPIADLETLQLLDQAIAKRDGAPVPPHQGPPFNHPIDRARLSTLEEGRRYRLSTPKGDIVLAIEPNAAPGTCVAFDSLVAARYYDGKYVHRVVPDFVAQGGCPRGDGYGSMDWTLRTEIGYEGFTTGAVGVASAGRDTESCQFFITLMPAPHLDGRYTRFAHVVSGMDVARRLVVGDVMTRVERLER